MTKSTTEVVGKTKKPSSKTVETAVDKTTESEEEIDHMEPKIRTGEESTQSSVGSETETEVENEESAEEDSDQVLEGALNTIAIQAAEHEIVRPPSLKAESAQIQEEAVKVVAQLNCSTRSRDSKNQTIGQESSEEESAATTSTGKRKLEVRVKTRTKKVSNLSRERRERLKARVADQVLTLVTHNLQIQGQLKQEVKENRIPKQSPSRTRQKKAVLLAKKHMGLSSRYERLSKLLEFHRYLVSGNPFKLIDPKQVYPHFYEVPGINAAHIQPLVRAWQEKATRILYQLLLLETKSEISRLKKQTVLLRSEPGKFVELFKLKIDMDLERDPALDTLAATVPGPPTYDNSGTTKLQQNTSKAIGPPPLKKDSSSLPPLDVF